MPSYIELDKQASFPASSNSGKIILGINNSNQLQATNSSGQSVGVTGLPYQVYTALLTQTGGSDPLNQVSGAVTKGVTYTVDEYFADTDFSNVGGGTFASPISPFVATSNDTPTNYNGSTLDYNSGAPVVNVLENTIGNIWFTYEFDGAYNINSNGLFTDNKTINTLNQTSNISSQNDTQYFAYCTSNGESILIITLLDSTLTNVNSVLFNKLIEIRVYN
jgi:hypothetical protein